MDIFLKTYVKMGKERLTKYGFKRTGNNFYRVVNDVYQNILLERSMSGLWCRICFGITPLCKRINYLDVKRGMFTRYELQIFDDKRDERHYDRQSLESITACITDIMDYIENRLIPFFEKASNSESAYHELCNLESSASLYFNNKIEMIDYSKFCMALKSGDYETALTYLLAIEEHWTESYGIKLTAGYLSEEFKIKHEKRMNIIHMEIEKIREKDEVYIRNFIEENEAYSRSEIK